MCVGHEEVYACKCVGVKVYFLLPDLAWLQEVHGCPHDRQDLTRRDSVRSIRRGVC